MALKNIDGFKIDNIISKSQIKKLEIQTVEKIKSMYANTNILVDEEINDVKYFYDIETGKKYIMLSIKSENHKDGSVGYAYYTEKYEI